MMDDGKNKDSGEFDDTFDEDFSDAEFDEASYEENSEYSEFSAEEGDYEGDDFESEDWGDEEESAGDPKKKAKKQNKSGGGLSFNAIVITGAVIVGAAVMVFNVMKETDKQKSTQTTMFQSILNIGGIMDGMLFGGGDSETAQQEEQAPADAGFLNDPGVLAKDDATPPQPTPLASAEQDVALEPLTPMPEATAPPRGPEELPPTEYTQADDQTPSAISTVRPVPAEQDAPLPVEAEPPLQAESTDQPATAASSAEDILKQAMANREQKLQQDEPPAAVVTEPAPAPAPVVSTPEPVTADEEQPVVTTSPPVQKEIAAQTPPSAVEPPALSTEDRQSLADSQRAVTALESKLDTLLERMSRIEGDLGTLKESASPQTEELEEAVAALRKDVADIKARPAAPAAPAASTSAPRREPASKKAETSSAPKPAPSASASKPKQAAAPRQQQGRWELRAAQPGRAWVSKTGDRDMQAVAVGDTLAGIGRISAITYQNGRWSIIGTQGAIQQ